MKTKMLLVAMSLLIGTAMAQAMTPGNLIPEVSAKNQNGKLVRLNDYRGQYMLIYFYPKDDTPGCTAEACNIRDNYSRFKNENVVIFGVSRQDEKSHQKFIAKHKLPFDLLVDSDGTIAKALGVGTVPVLGFTKRQSLLIGPDGKVIRFYSTVTPDSHVEEVLADLAKAKSTKN